MIQTNAAKAIKVILQRLRSAGTWVTEPSLLLEVGQDHDSTRTILNNLCAKNAIQTQPATTPFGTFNSYQLSR